MPLFILSILVSVALVVHIIKTGRNTAWIFIVLFAPMIGALAYFIVELLPEITHSRTGRRAQRSLSKAVNPERDFNEAARQLAIASTVQNAVAMANQYLERAQFAEAKALFESKLNGVHADDPVLLLGLAKAQFGLNEFSATLETLEMLKQTHPKARSPEGHLLYARAQEALGNADAAIHEYEVLRGYYPGPEPACRLALLLRSRGNTERAQALFQWVLNECDVAGKHYRTMHKEWVDLARREGSAS